MAFGGIHSVSTVSRIIGSIYDCAIDPSLWNDALADLRTCLGFHNANLMLQSLPSGEPLLSVASGIDDDWLEAMPRYGEDIVRQWGGPERMQACPMELPQVLSTLSPAPDWKNNRYYLEWAEPQGIIDVLAIGVARDRSSIGMIGLGRHRDAGPITHEVAAAAALFVPHVQRAVSISRLIEVKTVAIATFEAVLDTLSAAVVVVDDRLRIVHSNRAADDLFAAGQPVCNSGGVLKARLPAVTAALAAAVASAGENEAELARRSFGVPLRCGAGESCVLNVLPLRNGEVRGEIWPAAAAAIFISSASGRPQQVPLGLATLFDLTPAEVAVYNQLFGGASNAQIAAELGISIATVKTHLQHLFDKTGVRRQSQLLALAASFVLPLRH